MTNETSKFWAWYQKNLRLNTAIAAALFLLQLYHLYWLFTDVVLFKLVGQSYFTFDELWGRISIFFDYTEIPAIVTTSLVYVNELRQKFNYKSLAYLLMLNTQWLHILWITDEFVVTQFNGESIVAWGLVLGWIAILIDFLELPVIYDTTKKAVLGLKNRPESV